MKILMMDFNYKKGQRLVIELSSSQVFEGDYVSGSKNRIDLENIIEYPDTIKLKDVQCFYRSDIRHVSIIDGDGEQGENTTGKNNLNDDLLEKEKDTTKVAFSKNEYERLKNMMSDYIYMATTDRRYKEAIDHLNSAENIGVVGLGSQYGRSNTLNLLVLSTWDQVYIFDILSYGRKDFEPELKKILESPFIRKVVHDSRALIDCLFHCHKINMKNIFDTQVADIMIRKSEEGNTPESGRSLAEVLFHYFHLPPNLIEISEKTDVNKWIQRPLTDAKKKRAAILAVYLIVLKNNLEEIMLKEFYSSVKLYSTIARDSTCSMLTSNKSEIMKKLFK